MRFQMWLVSAETYEQAAKMASSQGLLRQQWRFIPFSPEGTRKEKLMGLRVPKDHLLGSFSTHEIWLLDRSNEQ